ncbi:hypothetical protein A4A49_14219 [Nicotiana attenuata]|uniref:TOG domain-containing protein n=1 Tax=Nicotiana attenuata TaxID=49451 RepID=A0A1J6HSH1_NICAT|nr:hypothetical protein A4A49_14219 [Nicotiana attenuata]
MVRKLWQTPNIPCLKDWHSLFLNTLNDDTLLLEVRIMATKAVINFIQSVPNSNEKERFQELLPGMMKTLTDATSNSDQEDVAEYALNFFIELAENEPKFLRRQLAIVVGSFIEIAEAENVQDGMRKLAVEFLITMVKAKERAPGMMKKLPLFTNRCFAMLLQLLLDIKDEPIWHTADIMHEDAGETNNYNFGKECLSRFSVALGGKTVAPIAIEQLSAFIVAPEWEKRHAALVALYQIAEGSSKVIIKYLEHVVNMVLHSFQDHHPRVRSAAIKSIGRLSVDFHPELQEQYTNQVLPALVAAMDEFQNPRVQVEAAAAVKIFCLTGKPETLVPHLDGILKKLLVLMQNDNQMVQEAALKALGGIANLYKEHFQKHYDFLMPYLKTILVNANNKYNVLLQSTALECISFVGMAVGKEKFSDDLKQVMEVVKPLLKSQDIEFVTIIYILEAWSRFCRCMEKDFLPYMSTVMPPLVECARLKLDKILFSADTDDCREMFGDSVHFVMFGKRMISITESDLLRGKSIACGIFGLLAQTLEEDFHPWISQAASVLVPLLKFYIHKEVRSKTIRAMYPLLISAKLAVEKGTAEGGNKSYFKKLSTATLRALRDALYSEPKVELCASILRELNKCLQICGSLLNKERILRTINKIKHVLVKSSRRKGDLVKRAKSEDFDAEEAELLRGEREQEEEVFINVGNILVTFIKIFKADFLPFLDKLSSYLLPMKGKDYTAAETSTCFLIFAKLVEDCGEAALKYCYIYLPFLLDSSNDENSGVRQNALYGLRLCAEYGGSVFEPVVGEALSRINVVITHLHAHEPENEHAYNNAVSALGKICQVHQESIDSVQVHFPGNP